MMNGDATDQPAKVTRGRVRIRLAFIALVPCLLLQLPLRSITEPYPAILLPAGGGVMRSHGDFTAFETECFAEAADGSQHAIAIADVLDAVPSDYLPYVVGRGFGINEGRDVRHARVPLFGSVQFSRPATASQIDETRGWLRASLRNALGIDAVRIHVLTYAVTTFFGQLPPRQERQLRHRATVELVRSAR